MYVTFLEDIHIHIYQVTEVGVLHKERCEA